MGIQALRERKDELAKQANNMIANAGDKGVVERRGGSLRPDD